VVTGEFLVNPGAVVEKFRAVGPLPGVMFGLKFEVPRQPLLPGGL
jgi:hypothetical protein